jgi:hypothetical protein
MSAGGETCEYGTTSGDGKRYTSPLTRPFEKNSKSLANLSADLSSEVMQRSVAEGSRAHSFAT